MKKNLFYIFTALVLLSTTSCDDNSSQSNSSGTSSKQHCKSCGQEIDYSTDGGDGYHFTCKPNKNGVSARDKASHL